MLGLRLRYQIAGFLFVLFTTVVLFMGYFNVTILSDQLQNLSLLRSRTGAENVHKFLFLLLKDSDENLETVVNDKSRINEFARYVGSIENLKEVEIFNQKGKRLAGFLTNQPLQEQDRKWVLQVILDGKMQNVLWALDPYSGVKERIEKYGLLEPRSVVSDFYIPVEESGKIIGVLHVSVKLEKTSRLIRFFFLGNLSLSMVFILTAFIAIYLWSENAINRPLRNLLKAQERLSRGDFDVHLDLNLPSNNELAVIANSFNKMARELKVYQEKLQEQTRELEQLNEQYRSLNENLEHQVEVKTLELREFFSLITHDLKIPLAAIKGYVNLLKKPKTGDLNDKQAKFINALETATTNLLRMVKNMLDSVKYEAEKVEYFIEDFDLIELVDEVEQNLHPVISEKSLNFRTIIPEECRNVHGDKNKIAQVLSNILSNAINYTPDNGDITLTAEEEEGSVEIRIRDSGPGIPPEQLERIFDKFQQIPGKESPSTSLGLGLYIVRKIMEGHGKRVWAESTEGKGSSFYFELDKARRKEDNRKNDQGKD